MSISAGLVGLPNVGKSTLFNALTNSSAPAENYPFCTINPHIACTPVPDERLKKLQEIYKSGKIIASTIEFVDIAGLVKGAASGEGLGNQFLSNIRQVDLILHVLRCFKDPEISYKNAEEIDPLADYEIITTELMLKDLESVSKRKEKVQSLLKSTKNDLKKNKILQEEDILLDQLTNALNANDINKIRKIAHKLPSLHLLCAKNFLIIANVSEEDIQQDNYKSNIYYQKLVNHFGSDSVIAVCAKFEYEFSQLSPKEQEEMRNFLNITYNGLNQIISKTYEKLDLITFFTCGPEEIHAWPIKKGTKIRQAAGEIHSDLERGFICSEVFNFRDLENYGSTQKIKEAGKIRTEGQDYQVTDGDIVFVKFNV